MANFKDELTPTGQTWIATRHNVKAAEWAEVAVLAFREACGGEMDETALYDLVANLGHLCDRLTAEFEDFDMDFDSMVERAIVPLRGRTRRGRRPRAGMGRRRTGRGGLTHGRPLEPDAVRAR
jgi:hypothetical protein